METRLTIRDDQVDKPVYVTMPSLIPTLVEGVKIMNHSSQTCTCRMFVGPNLLIDEIIPVGHSVGHFNTFIIHTSSKTYLTIESSSANVTVSLHMRKVKNTTNPDYGKMRTPPKFKMYKYKLWRWWNEF